jgi:hypothetical protein
MQIRAAVMGLGPVGRSIARAALEHGDIELVAAVERDPTLAGRRLSELIDGVTSRVLVTADATAAFAELAGGVLLHATGSRLPEVTREILSAVEAHMSVVSSCPQLAFPWIDHPKAAQMLDRAAHSARVAVLGTGVNPGFVLDRLVVSAAAASGNVRHVHAVRSVNISNRRAPLLRRAGVGLSKDEFQTQVACSAVGHVGLVQSCSLVARGLGVEYEELGETIEPVFAESLWEGNVRLRRGDVSGYRQRAYARKGGNEQVVLELIYAVSAADRDVIVIDADPKVEVVIPGGISGDVATAWAIVNAAPSVVNVEPGLRSVLDLPPSRRAAVRTDPDR